MPPSASSKEELKAKMLSGLSEAMTVASKDAATAASLKQFVQAACQQVAEATKLQFGIERTTTGAFTFEFQVWAPTDRRTTSSASNSTRSGGRHPLIIRS